MSAIHLAGGGVAAAVIGSAGASKVSGHQVARELAATGVGHVTFLLVLAALLLLAGLLALGLVRRHAP